MATGKDNGANLPLFRPSRETEGPLRTPSKYYFDGNPKREGEGLYTGLGKTLTSHRYAAGPFSPVKDGRGLEPSARGRARRSGCSGR
jgi:hypothetical protein